VCLDIVSLRTVNDHYGYEVGDEVLRAVADALNESARKADLIARYGGDEFAVLLLDANLESADAIVDRVQAQLAELVPKRGLPGPIECAIGIARAGVLPETPDDLLIEADADMQRRRAAP
jgi:diguanylate cyclase (GGDEF)-like protein